MFDHEATFGLLLRAIEARSARDPAGFAEAVFSRMVGFTGYLTLRSQYYLTHVIRTADRQGQSKGTPALPREVTDVYLPRLMELQGHLGELAQLQASTARLWELARQRRLENDQAERDGSRPRPRRRPPASPPLEVPAGSAYGADEPVNRLAGLLEGLP
jgi:hypothetical protein